MNTEPAYALANPVAAYLDKPARDLTRSDLMRLVEEKRLERITFHYTALDGRLKELKIPALSRRQVERILAMGERVDGSSLFKGMVDAALSDLYVVPEYRTAFINPFDPLSLDFICRFFTKQGDRAPYTPDNTLARAAAFFRRQSGLELNALGELEFFLLGRPEPDLYPPGMQRSYHESLPFVKNGPVLDEMVRAVGMITGAVKYAHSEVGHVERLVSANREIDGLRAEQMEIEFLPRPVEEAADSLVISRWIIRSVAYRHGLVATFAPKIEEGVAGNGLHFHLELLEDGRSAMTEQDGSLSERARRLIGGLCRFADSLMAFGNTVAASYLRLVPDHEAPTRVCWSDLNRSALIRVPLGWANLADLGGRLNPQEKEPFSGAGRQTVELRSPDGSALIHLLLAGITVAAARAFGNTAPGEDPLALAEKLYVSGNIFRNSELLSRLPRLPGSCAESARLLLEKRALYEEGGIFPAGAADYVAGLLEAEDDENLRATVQSLPEDERLGALRRVMHRDIHRH
jgi:glutamine synthetase